MSLLVGIGRSYKFGYIPPSKIMLNPLHQCFRCGTPFPALDAVVGPQPGELTLPVNENGVNVQLRPSTALLEGTAPTPSPRSGPCGAAPRP